MEKIICVFILLLLFVTGFTQTPIRNRIEAKITELKQSKVDTIFNYHSYCVGCIEVYEEKITGDTTKCNSFDNEYLMWKKNGQTFIQLFDQCYNYHPISANLDRIFNILKSQLPQLIKEKIKPVKIEVLENGRKTYYTTSIDHSGRYDLKYYLREKEVFKKQIDDFELNTDYDEYIDHGKPVKHRNINYKYNQSTYIKRLIDIVEQKIKDYQFQKQ